jgi:putative hydrolase of the HAD superfamily
LETASTVLLHAAVQAIITVQYLGVISVHSITTIGFDADDTLWQTESFFRLTQDKFTDLLADYAQADHLHDRLLAAERRNLGHYGFGVKGFVLSMIETAIEVTQGRVPASVIAELMDAGRDMLRHPIELLPHAEAAVRKAAEGYRVLLITKGDLLDQERKLAQSGLGDLFHGVEIVSDKTPEAYSRIFDRHGQGAKRALMVGNSLKSDVLPVIEAGGRGVYVPHGLTWAMEHAEAPEGHPRFHTLPNLSGLSALLTKLHSCTID